MTPTYPTICHRDGSVTLWDEYEQRWIHTSDQPGELLVSRVAVTQPQGA